jgi:RNA-directed DNA polymerase
LEPIFEADFQAGSYGYRPGRTAHQALGRVYEGLNKRLHRVIDLDLKNYFDRVRHDLMLSKLARRIRDGDILRLCKCILKASGKRGLAQGSVLGPLWANLYLNEVDRMLERAQERTRRERYETVSYTRFADDLVVLVSAHPSAQHWEPKVEKRLKEELSKLDLAINEEKSRTVDFGAGEAFHFLGGYTFRWVYSRKQPGKKFVLRRPQKERRTRFLRELRTTLRRHLHVPVERVVQEIVNPRVRGWVHYFRWGNAAKDLDFVRRDPRAAGVCYFV